MMHLPGIFKENDISTRRRDSKSQWCRRDKWWPTFAGSRYVTRRL